MELEYDVRYLYKKEETGLRFLLGSGRSTSFISPDIFLTPVTFKYFSEHNFEFVEQGKITLTIICIDNLNLYRFYQPFGYVYYYPPRNTFKHKNEETKLIELADWYRDCPVYYYIGMLRMAVIIKGQIK